MARPRIAAGALFTDEAGRVLLVKPIYKPYWDIPGGYVEPGESPLAACVRELREELAIAPPIGPHLVVDWAPADGEGDKILFIFDGGMLPAASLNNAVLQRDELAELKFVPAADIERYVPPRLSRRINTALQAKADCQSTYAEHGNAPTR